MSLLFEKIRFGANAVEDLVHGRIGHVRWSMSYQSAFEMCHKLRMGCKTAARADRAPATFVYDMDQADLKDVPKVHRGFRRSRQVPTLYAYNIRTEGGYVIVGLQNHRATAQEATLSYEDGIKLHNAIRTAGRRAKAWAGDTSKQRTLLGNLTNAEEDYRLGLM